MRPLRLEVEGFTSFRDRIEVAFEGLDLFAITGATGAGKSSLIDAMVFALYGQVPRVGDDYKQLISHGKDRTSVLFEFGVGRERYRIARVARRGGASQQRLERLAAGDPEPLADRVRDIRARVEEILGLDYDGFTRSVVLPQGQFDAFLKGEPKERRKILVALLRLGVYDDMLKVANAKGAAARQEAGYIAQSLERDFAGATGDARAALEAERLAAGSETEAVQRALATIEEGLSLARRVRAARLEVSTLGPDMEQEEQKRRGAEALLARGDEERAALGTQIEELAARLEAVRFDDLRHRALVAARPRAEQLVELEQAHDRLGAAREQVAGALGAAREGRGRAEAAVVAAAAACQSADAALQVARSERDVAHRLHAAYALRRGLRPGEACPVCEQRVKAVPPGVEPALDEAEARASEAEARVRGAQGEEQRARVAFEKARAEEAARAAELTQLDERRDESSSRVAACGAALAGFAPGDAKDARSVLSGIDAELEALEAARRGRAEIDAARADLEKKRATLDARLAAATAERDGASQRLEALGGRHGAATNALEEARGALAALADRESWSGLAGTTAGKDEVDLLEACRRARLDASREVAARAARLRQRIEQVEEKIARAAELRERHARLEADSSLLKALADHLRANELVAWIQEEALLRLAEDGTAHLSRLSQGRYALRLGSGDVAEAGARAEQDFFVVDRWSADSVRSVRTLSGGETFLASLSLALALAESLASLSVEGRAGDALESLFLDEGFGALDAETLDVVVDALDALHGGERMVGIVTHVRELAERLPARLEVRKAGPTATAAVV